MDELKLKLSTKLMRNMVTKLISKTIQKKYGYNVDILLNELDVTFVNGRIHLHANVDAEINNNEFMKIVKSIGLD